MSLPHQTVGKSKDCDAFEGFMDYLSFLTLRQESCPNYPELDGRDYIVLTSYRCLIRLHPLGNYERIHCFFDNDHAGMEALRQIRMEYGRDRYIRDASQIYSGCKDLNEYLHTVLVSPHFIMSCNSLLFIFLGLFVNPVQKYGKKVRKVL